MRSVALSSATNRFAGSMAMVFPASSVGCPSRDFDSLRVTADDGSFWPTKLSIASINKRRFCVKSCEARVRPLVTTTAA